MRRSIPVVAATLGLALTLAACSGSSGETSDDASASAPAESAGTLTVWVDDTRSGPVKEVATKFEEEKGVTVKLVQKDFGEIRDDFISQAPTGQGPDVVVGAHDWLGKLVQNGVVAPIELGDKAADFLPVSTQAMSYEGTLYGLPYSVENIALVKNKSLVPDATPATFDELVAQAKAVGTDYSVLVQQDEKTGDPYHLYPLQTSFGAPVFGTDGDGAYDATQLGLDSDGGRAFAAYVSKLGAEGVLNTSVSGDVAKEAFIAGKAPYMITGPWNVGDFVNAGIDVAIEKVPSAGGQPSQPFVGVQGFFISSKSENALLANEFVVNYLGTKDVQLAMYEAGGRAPALQSALDEIGSDPVVAGFAEVGKDGVPMPSIPAMDTVWSDWGATEVALVNQQGDPTTLWNQMSVAIATKIAAS
ncbi:sugar ABC transporter substrate-binding protein [Cellulomonas fimi]|uniref:Extracellular solute-binding protein family 1 n=1 Tax=Cellulomonas fimi (strain ATCC 484 / DSM 20113 / JCM 1341 / CCUG 24087 / LMG 16345 / NBRC 15513 / NCIMB 8980 / NCTC 7547 / NRS-133) TaxID=590998 RepID=F4H2U2_CELFA|nr:maltose ABC transporter substrate-binding protein [Cellulomonas fimi]AEE46441.1 extracellular solute-binding protein family 1 [Cellulomonas fimi ATCC 484]NNH07733.1 maltose ABC transporter substrate-binding protein [Cellulomonas fimi]VEH33011.1 Maltodextrin-binding protein [Cellulomonas fimi]